MSRVFCGRQNANITWMQENWTKSCGISSNPKRSCACSRRLFGRGRTGKEARHENRKESHCLKLNTESNRKNCEEVVSGPTKPARRVDGPEVSAKVAGPGHFRRLKMNEVVSHGDFVANERLGFEPWEGPGGFRAGAFLKPIYRRKETGSRPEAKRKSKRNTKHP